MYICYYETLHYVIAQVVWCFLRIFAIMKLPTMLLLKLFGAPYVYLLLLSVSFITMFQMSSIYIFCKWQTKF